MQRFFVIVCALVFLKDCPAYFWGVCGNKGERMCLWTLESSVPLVTCILTFLNCLSRGVGSAGVLYCSWRGQKGAGQNNEKAYSGTPFQFTFLTLQRKKKSSFVQSTMLVTAVNERLIGQSPDTTGDMRICGVDRKTGKRTIN